MAGVAKCGTTDLYRRIRIHPDVMRGELKEYHWWDRLRYGAPMELKYTEDSEKNDSELNDFVCFQLGNIQKTNHTPKDRHLVPGTMLPWYR